MRIPAGCGWLSEGKTRGAIKSQASPWGLQAPPPEISQVQLMLPEARVQHVVLGLGKWTHRHAEQVTGLSQLVRSPGSVSPARQRRLVSTCADVCEALWVSLLARPA